MNLNKIADIANAESFIFSDVDYFSFVRSSSVPRHEYSALRSDSCSERNPVRDGAFTTCKSYLSTNERYELKSHLEAIGSRSEKHWWVAFPLFSVPHNRTVFYISHLNLIEVHIFLFCLQSRWNKEMFMMHY